MTAIGINYVKTISFGNVKYDSDQEPRRVHKTKGDGNCYFRCISYVLSGTEENHKIIRTQIVQHMRSISSSLESYLSQNMENYLDDSGMENNSVWATEAETFATASLLETDIVIYAQHGNKHSWLPYTASLTLSVKTIYALFLVNMNNDHFNVVIS
jgi:hypothetical protein